MGICLHQGRRPPQPPLGPWVDPLGGGAAGYRSTANGNGGTDPGWIPSSRSRSGKLVIHTLRPRSKNSVRHPPIRRLEPRSKKAPSFHGGPSGLLRIHSYRSPVMTSKNRHPCGSHHHPNPSERQLVVIGPSRNPLRSIRLSRMNLTRHRFRIRTPLTVLSEWIHQAAGSHSQPKHDRAGVIAALSPG
jgi:hypothetical protein